MSDDQVRERAGGADGVEIARLSGREFGIAIAVLGQVQLGQGQLHARR